MDAIAQARALLDGEAALTQHLAALARFATGNVHRRDEAAAQQLGEGQRVELVGLDLRLGDEPALARIGPDEVALSHHVFELIVDALHVHARFDRHARARAEAFDQISERLAGVTFDTPVRDGLAAGSTTALTL